jgi:hypothetical protein
MAENGKQLILNGVDFSACEIKSKDPQQAKMIYVFSKSQIYLARTYLTYVSGI